MLILILIDVEYSQKAVSQKAVSQKPVFSFEKGLNGQNREKRKKASIFY